MKNGSLGTYSGQRSIHLPPVFISKKSSAENYLLSCLILYFFQQAQIFWIDCVKKKIFLYMVKLKAEFGSLCLYICTHLFLKSSIMKLSINNIFETVSSDVLTTQICWFSSFWEHSTLFGRLAFLLGIISLCFNAALVQLCLSWITAARAGTFRKVVRFKYAKFLLPSFTQMWVIVYVQNQCMSWNSILISAHSWLDVYISTSEVR